MKANTLKISEEKQSKQSKQQDKCSAHFSVIDLIKDLLKTTLSNMLSDQLESLEHQIDVIHQINCVMTSHMNAANAQLTVTNT